ncbi:MAG: TonB-dependent receptor, partial [Glaciecola sp.]
MQKTLGKMCVVGAMITPAHAFATDITGTILDSQSQPIPGAVVEIINTQYSAVADADGKFSLSNLPEGPVELHITAPNFIHQSIDLTVLADEQSFDVALQPSSLEVIDVYATPFHASVIESSLPVTVLAGDALRLAQTSTLGETLNSQVGVHSTYFGGVASSPIIRGLDGPRVLVTQNGLDASDASRVGADHVVAAETATAQQIEVLRGPATLFYGSGAIGGVVNVVDQRIPTTAERQGRFLASTSTVNSGKHLSGAGQFAINENVVLYADGVWRDADEYEADKVIEETQSDTTAFTLGASYLLENGFVGLSYERTDRQNGLPGHAHGHEEDDEHVEDHDEGHDEHDEEAHDVYSDLQQDRVQLLSDVYFENQLFSKVSTKLAYTDYTHAEIEEGEVGTRFNNETLEAKMTFLHQPINGWKGGLSVHAKHTDFAAVGEEAFTPASKTEMFGLALMEEKHIGDVLVQFGARVESVSITADGVEYDPEIFTAGHVDESHEDVLVAEEQHDHDHSDHVV